MMFNEFIDKALEAARKSIQQIYGDNYSEIKNAVQNNKGDGNNNENAKNQLPSKRNGHQQHTQQQKQALKSLKQREQFNANLESIREYAAKQIDLSLDEITQWRSKEDSTNASDSSIQLYSRRDLQTSTSKPKVKDENKLKKNGSYIGDLIDNNKSEKTSKQVNKIVDRYISKNNRQTDKNGDDNNNLHTRLDKLESLMHLTLSSSDSDFSGHPLFHKLLQKGVPAKFVNEWFNTLVEQGINPDKQRALFRSKLALLIQDLLETSVADEPAKNLLFTGRSGVGKTTLIMKLSRSKYMRKKKIAVVSLAPQKVSQYRYSILAPYCKDHDIPYWDLKKADEFEQLFKRWKGYDHVLIDTPFLEENTNHLIAEILAIQETVKKYNSIETHYIINTAIHKMAFNDPLKSEVKADYLALTKIDKATKWGKTIQVIANTDCTIRYISNGASLSRSLIIFDSQKSTQKLLR